MKLHAIFRPYMRPADDEFGSGGGGDDRGDNFTPTGPDADGQDDDQGDDKGAKTAAKDSADDEDEDDEADEKAEKVEKDEKADEEGDEGEEGEEGGGKAKKKGQPRIPLSRHKEMLEKERAKRQDLERQLAQFQRGKEVAAVNEDITKAEDKIVALEGQYNSAMADGDVEKATKLMREIRTLDRQVSDAKAEMRSAASEARAVEQVRFSAALERIEESFPQLNEDSAEFNAELMQDVVDLKATYERRGMTPTQAMQKAVKKLVDVDTSKQKAATEVAPRVSEKDVAAERKKEAVKKTSDATGRTPPSTSKVGHDSDRAGGALRPQDVLKMSQADFAQLDDKELARLRGDEL